MFETDGPSGSIINKRLGHTTAHEAGHQLDFLYNPSSSYSHTAAIQSAIDRDIQSMNLIPACNFEAMDASGLYASTHTPVPAITGGLSGFFSGFTDSHGDQICNDRSLAAKYAGFTTDGTDNFKIMQAAFPYFKNIYTLPDSDPNHELFAEIFAVLARYSDLDDDSHNPAPIVNDTLIGQAFVCTYLAILKKSTDGTERTATELNSSGYAVPDSFGGAVYGPGTRVHSCDGAVQPIEYYGFGT